MANPSKDKGTRAETAVVRYLGEHGVRAERKALHGSADEGDVRADLADGVTACIEVKARKRVDLAKWMAETAAERDNAGAGVGILVVKPAGVGRPGRWWACMELDDLMEAMGR